VTESVLCRLAAIAILVAGGVHSDLWLEHGYRETHVIGPLFATTTLAAFFFSVYHGLFGYVESLRGPWQEAAGGVELAALALLATFLAGALVPAARRPSLRQTTRPKLQ